MPRISGKIDVDGVLPRIGAAIRAGRLKKQLSQEALADAAALDRSHMGKIERGERNVTVLNLARIAAALDLQLSELLRGAQL